MNYIQFIVKTYKKDEDKARGKRERYDLSQENDVNI